MNKALFGFGIVLVVLSIVPPFSFNSLVMSVLIIVVSLILKSDKKKKRKNEKRRKKQREVR